jgi:hypothetical protein
VSLCPCKDHGRTRSLTREGYCKINRGGHRSLHREVYAQANGLTADDIAGIVVRHKCDNTRCIEPTHLEPGTWADNNKDRAARGRSAKNRPDLRHISDDVVRYIRANYKQGSRETGAKALSRQFQIDRKAVYQIRHRLTYRDVA